MDRCNSLACNCAPDAQLSAGNAESLRVIKSFYKIVESRDEIAYNVSSKSSAKRTVKKDMQE